MKTLDRLKQDWGMATEIHKLEARLWRIAQRDGIKVILVTSAVRGEGKSTTVAFLATALAMSPERRILAVDLDLRDPQLATHFAVSYSRGIDDLLAGRSSIEEATIRTKLPGLDLISAVPGVDDPAVLLRTTQLHELLRTVRARYDLIIVDSPALIPVADTSVLIPLSDAVLFVGMAGKTTKLQLSQARAQCLGLGANLLGLVISNLREHESEYGYVGSYYPAGNDRGAGAGEDSGIRDSD